MITDIENFKIVANQLFGNITAIAKHYNVSRQTMHNWINDNIQLKDIITDSKNTVVDSVENTMFKLIFGIPELNDEKKQIGWIEKPDKSLIMFYLKTQAKDRGYIERVENLNMDVKTFDDLPTLNEITNKDVK